MKFAPLTSFSPLICNTPMNALLVGDIHLAYILEGQGASYFSQNGQEEAFAGLKSLCKPCNTSADSPFTHVFVLGDTFHYGLMTEEFEDKSIERIVHAIVGDTYPLNNTKVVFIGGNHDRQLFASPIKQQRWRQYAPDNVTVSGDLAIRVQSSRGNDVAWLTHDGSNNRWLSDAEIIPFLRGIKDSNVSAGIVAQDDFLICAHTHKAVALDHEKVASVGSFNGDRGGQYGVLSELPSGMFSFKLCSLK